MQPTTPGRSWKQKLLHELSDYGINFAYMGLFFSAIIFYRRQVLAQYDIELNDYFLGLIKAAIVAKVVMIAGFLSFMKCLDQRPLLYPVLFKGFTFTLWVMLFDLLEESVHGLIKHASLAELPALWVARMEPVWFASGIIVLLCFLPFFAFKELVRVEGRQKVTDLFLRDRRGKD